MEKIEYPFIAMPEISLHHPLKTKTMEKETDVNTELRDIISHALLGEDENISREGFNLVLQEVEKFIESYSDQKAKKFAEWLTEGARCISKESDKEWVTKLLQEFKSTTTK